MPRYDYVCTTCGVIDERTHSMADCDKIQLCVVCNVTMKRLISAPHIEGSLIYPFEMWNIRLPKGQKSMTIHSKAHHRQVLQSRGLDAPALHVGG